MMFQWKEHDRNNDSPFFIGAIAILTIYLCLLFFFQAIASDVSMSVPFLLCLCLFALGSSFFLCRVFAQRISNIKFEAREPHSRIWGLAAFLLVFSFLMVAFLGRFPGGMSQDTISQYKQAMGDMQYTDWHPAVHTFLFFTLPLATGGGLGLIVFLQVLYFSLAFGYLIYVLHSNGCPKSFLAVICGFVCLNPYVRVCMMFPWKDIGFTIFSMLIMAYYVQMISSKGEWLGRKKNLAAFSLVVVICLFMRHNAILFVAPLVLIALFYALKDRKKRVAALSIMICGFVVVKVLCVAANVEAPDSRKLETVGLPVTIWCNVMQKNPDALPQETQDVFYSFATQQAYETAYSTGNFNSIKWTGLIDNEKIDALSYGDVIKYTWQCFRFAPAESLIALAKLTAQVWGVNGGWELADVDIEANDYGVTQSHVPGFEALTGQLESFFSIGVGKVLFGSIGLELLVMLITAMLLLVKRRVSFLHIIPLFCYDFGTMLLLSGPDYRFFFLNLPLWLPVVFIMLKDQTTWRRKSDLCDEI